METSQNDTLVTSVFDALSIGQVLVATDSLLVLFDPYLSCAETAGLKNQFFVGTG